MQIATAQSILRVKIPYTSVICVLLLHLKANRCNLVQICQNLMIFDQDYHLGIIMRKSFITKYRLKCAVFRLVSQLFHPISWPRLRSVKQSLIRVNEHELSQVVLKDKLIRKYTALLLILNTQLSQRRLGIENVNSRYENATPWKMCKNYYQIKMTLMQ